MTLAYVLSCSNDAFQASGLDLSKETVEVIANPYMISGDDAMSTASNFLRNRTLVSEHTEGLISKKVTSVSDLTTRSSGHKNNFKVKNDEIFF